MEFSGSRLAHLAVSADWIPRRFPDFAKIAGAKKIKRIQLRRDARRFRIPRCRVFLTSVGHRL
jgi:hypothetical protein